MKLWSWLSRPCASEAALNQFGYALTQLSDKHDVASVLYAGLTEVLPSETVVLVQHDFPAAERWPAGVVVRGRRGFAYLDKKMPSFTVRRLMVENRAKTAVVVTTPGMPALVAVIQSKRALSRKTKVILRTMAFQTAGALGFLTQAGAIQNEEVRANLVGRFVEELHATTNLNALYKEVSERLSQAFNCSAVILFRRHDVMFSPAYVHGQDFRKVENLCYPQSFVTPFLKSGQFFRLDAWPALAQELIQVFPEEAHGFVFILELGNNVLGFLVGLWPEKPPRLDNGVLHVLCHEVSSALANAELYQQVMQVEQYHANVLENLVLGIMTIDQNGHCLSFNRQAQQLTGLSHLDVVGRSTLALQGRFPFLSRLGSVRQSRSVVLEMTFEGEEHPVAITLSAYTIPKMGQSGWVVLFEDLKPMRRLSQKIKDAEKWATIGKVAAGIAKHIQHPLTAVKAMIEVIDRATTVAERDHYARLMGQQLDQIQALCQALLNLGRSQPGGQCLFNTLVSEVLLLVHGLVDADRLIIETHFEGDLSLVVDRHVVMQTLVVIFQMVIDGLGGTDRLILKIVCSSTPGTVVCRFEFETIEGHGGRIFDPVERYQDAILTLMPTSAVGLEDEALVWRLPKQVSL
ncbi:MAG: PAS domain S-box protein [Candidatus Margulisiibacteriota bacterium]